MKEYLKDLDNCDVVIIFVLHILCIFFPFVLLIYGMGLCPDIMEDSPLVMRVRLGLMGDGKIMPVIIFLYLIIYNLYLSYGIVFVISTYRIFGISTYEEFVTVLIPMVMMGLLMYMIMSLAIGLIRCR